MHTNWRKIYISTGISLVLFLSVFGFFWYRIVNQSNNYILEENKNNNLSIEAIDNIVSTNTIGDNANSMNNEAVNIIASTIETDPNFFIRLNEVEQSSTTYVRLLDHEVPFTSQAPFAEWDDPRQQDGCEEASVLMAVKYIKNETLDSEIAKQEILDCAEYQEETFGSYIDTSAKDTAERILKKYYGISIYKVIEIKTTDTLIDLVMNNNIIIAPMNGQALENPYFFPPGPERHMLLIRGYDPESKEFITNDPGTKRGEAYRYSEDIIFSAIRDYPSGDNARILNKKKHIIVLKIENNPKREKPIFYKYEND